MTIDNIRLTHEEAEMFDRDEFDEMNKDRFGGCLELIEEEDGTIAIKLPGNLCDKDVNDAHLLIQANHCGGRM